MDKQLPKLLVVSTNAWRDNTGINTLIELFKFWDKDKLAQIYTKSALPNTKICKYFYQISETQVLKSVFNRKINPGKVITQEYIPSEEDIKSELEESARYKKARGKQSWILAIARDLVWKLGKWNTRELDDFLDDYNPDVIFIPIYPTIYMGVLQNYILKKTNKPAVCYLADDNYTYKPLGYNPLAYIHRFFLRKVVKSIVSKCSKMFVIAPKQKEEYDKIFDVDSVILTKGIDFSGISYEVKENSTPIKMVYTGKLIIGRWKSLVAIANALGEINKQSIKIELDIYTTDSITNKQYSLLNRNGCRIKGAVPLSEVADIQRSSDIVVFVESLENKYKNIARLSFSTKITDYLKSGKCIFAIGDKNIAPIDYLKKNDAAIIATSYEEILSMLKKLVNDSEIIKEYGKKSYDCGIRNHNQNIVKETLIRNIMEAYENEQEYSL